MGILHMFVYISQNQSTCVYIIFPYVKHSKNALLILHKSRNPILFKIVKMVPHNFPKTKYVN